MKKAFDPKAIELIFKLVADVKGNILAGALSAAMANMVKALDIYLDTPMLKKEREVLEEDFFNLLQKMANHPKFAEIYGPVSFRRGEHAMNSEFMTQLIKFTTDNFNGRIAQGIEILEAGGLEATKKIFNEVMDDPNAEISHFVMMGDAYLKKQLWKEAQEVFLRAVAKDPESINVLNRMAIAYRKDQKYNEALAAYRKAVMLSPMDEGLYYNVARLFLEMGKPKSAGQALHKALAINPKFERAAKLLVGVQEAMLKTGSQGKN